MATLNPGEGRPAEGGIFTSWDKVLERIERQYDTILAKLDSKVDNSTFSQFVATYEQRHERLAQEVINKAESLGQKLSVIEKDLQQRTAEAERYIPDYRDFRKDMTERIGSLEDERLSRDAVKNDRKLLYYGGGVLSLLVLVNLVVNIAQGTPGVP